MLAAAEARFEESRKVGETSQQQKGLVRHLKVEQLHSFVLTTYLDLEIHFLKVFVEACLTVLEIGATSGVPEQSGQLSSLGFGLV